jgi:hypothetical protein
MRAALAVLFFAFSCESSEPAASKAGPVAKASPSAAAVPAGPACGGAEIEKTLVDSCIDAPIQDTRKLALAKWSATHRGAIEGVPIVVTAKGAELYGRPIVADEVSSAIVNRRGFDDAGGASFVLAIEADAKLADVQPVLAALLAAEATNGVLLYGSATSPRTPAPLHPEIHARFTAKIEALDPSERAVTAARELETLVAPCAPLKEAFGSVAAEAPDNRCAKLMRSAVKAIVSCDCPTWTPELFSWLQVLGGPADAPRIHADAVTLAPAAATKASKTTTWSKLLEGRTTTIDALWFELAE